ncbi:hypothetical protein WOLCODRAFT_136437 [Wolfiporia cocos MD-104 SS10]|uniref:Endoplasmic reticulum-based factor for assembly of V-ATPase n=1 Tax=Wolfiporia cocos (strain MD-104) TaxID=742152 RepID=A0A2H3J9B0_WOLCO|nr:hypothetical protein WOLCODRAFT_136437 [Wolfiporia cocos MD-104 SS10]
MPATQDLNVSLEAHLTDTLRPLLNLVPAPLSTQLNATLSGHDDEQSSSLKLIPYSLLSSVSAWARSAEGMAALASHEPPLHVSDYTMIALLAGTRTSPERNFPDAPVRRTPEEEAQKSASDRRAITALLNALLSILGSGGATWWAAGRLAWKEEWKVLLALFVAIVVAVSEAVLYLIWDSRRSRPPASRGTPRAALSARIAERLKKTDGSASAAHEPGPSVKEGEDGPVTGATSATDASSVRGTLRARGRNISAAPQSDGASG